MLAEEDDVALVPGRSAGGSSDCGGGQAEDVFTLCTPAGDGKADGSVEGSVDGSRELPGDGRRLCPGEEP